MKILHISTSDKNGGAALGAFRLHNAMLQHGLSSESLVLVRNVNDRSDIKTVSKYDGRIKRIINMILEYLITKNMHGVKGLFSSFKFGINIANYQEVIDADIIYLHWINSFVNYRTLKQILKLGKPVFWFLRDMFAITGGCHYSFDCIKYQSQCRNCPNNQTGCSLIDLSKRQYAIKKKIYKQYDNLMFICTSKWMINCAKNSGLTKNKQIYHIPNLVDTAIYKPLNKEMVRQLFSLDRNKKIIGFGAFNALTNPYKGWEYLKDALELIAEDAALNEMQIELLIFGSSYSKEMADNLPFPVHFFGYLHDDYSLSVLYNCMDVFVIPSLMEAFGQTIIESLATDTPVVGFNTGGIPDMVNENAGYLAEYKNSVDLAKGITHILKYGRKNVVSSIAHFKAEYIVEKHYQLISRYGRPAL
jgi:glycosyltransferase involved in cell wall biosynthesis